MTLATTSAGLYRSRLRYLPVLGLGFALIALALLALAPTGWRAGWWPLRFSFFILMPSAGYFGIAAVVVSALALLLGRAAIDRRGAVTAVAALILGGLAILRAAALQFDARQVSADRRHHHRHG